MADAAAAPGDRVLPAQAGVILIAMSRSRWPLAVLPAQAGVIRGTTGDGPDCPCSPRRRG